MADYNESIGDAVAECIRSGVPEIAISRRYVGYKGMDVVAAAILESTTLKSFDVNRLLHPCSGD